MLIVYYKSLKLKVSVGQVEKWMRGGTYSFSSIFFLSQASAGPAERRRMRWFFVVRSCMVWARVWSRSAGVAFSWFVRVLIKSWGCRMGRLGSSRVR